MNLEKYTSLHHPHIKMYIKKLIKCFSNYIPVNRIRNIINEKDVDLLIDELVNDKDCE